MNEIASNARFNQETCEIVITGLSTEVKINYSEDVDFTDLVSILTKTIDENKRVSFSFSNSTDENKLILIQETIEEIFKEFNNAIEDVILEVGE